MKKAIPENPEYMLGCDIHLAANCYSFQDIGLTTFSYYM